MTTYEMTTLGNGTRIRDDHNTAGNVLTSVNANVTVRGDQVFVATEELRNANGVYQYVGDKWLRITYNGVTGWMAYSHRGEPICKDWKEIGGEAPPPPEPSDPVFPDFYDLVDPQGNKQRYVKSDS